MSAKRGPKLREDVLASYVDQGGRRHRIELRGRLVLDLCSGRPAVLIADLSAEEGTDQARAAVFGGEFDVGYLARAQAGEWPLGRQLGAADLGPRQTGGRDQDPRTSDRPDADERLAA